MNKKIKMLSLKKISLLILVAYFIPIFPGYALGGAYEYLNYIEDTITAMRSAEQIQNQLQEIRTETTNTKSLSNYQWRNNERLIQQLDSNMQEGQSLSYSMSNVSQHFQERYPNYSTSPMGRRNYTQAYQQWNSTTLDTLRDTLSTASMSASNFNNEHVLLQNLIQQGKNARGRMQVMQVSTELATENVNQLQELRRLESSQINSQNAYMAYQVSKDSYNEAGLEAIESHTNTKFPAYHNNAVFGTIPPM